MKTENAKEINKEKQKKEKEQNVTVRDQLLSNFYNSIHSSVYFL